MRPLLLALLLSTVTGCSALDRVNDALYATGAFDLEPSSLASNDCSVTVVAGSRRGRGVVTGKTTVLTVAHVIEGETHAEVATSGFTWTEARVVRRIPSAPEDLVELELAGGDGFDRERIAHTGEGAPSAVLTARGAHAWRFARNLHHGDSGSPVLDDAGVVVGLLVGKTSDGRGVMSALPSSTVVVAKRH